MGKRVIINEALLRELVALRRSNKHIASVFGVSTWTVYKHLRDLGLSNPAINYRASDAVGQARYAKWRQMVLMADKYVCQECGSRKRLTAHHIRAWARHEELRYDINNGITLCHECHKKTYKKEEAFERFYADLLLEKRGTSVPFVPVKGMIPPITKICRRCKIEKPFDTFLDRDIGRFGKDTICLECKREESRINNNANPNHAIISAAYYWEHRDERRRYVALWHMSKTLKRGGSPKWNPARVELGIVPPNEVDWLIDDIIRQYRKDNVFGRFC